MTTNSLSALFKLCLARRALEQISVQTISVRAAALDIDEQIEILSAQMQVPVTFVWDMFASTGNHIKEVVNAVSVEEVHVH